MGGMGCPFLLHVTSGEGLPWASHGRTTSVPTSAAIFTVLSGPLTPIILGMAVKKGKKWYKHHVRTCFVSKCSNSETSYSLDRPLNQTLLCLGDCGRTFMCLTVDTELDLSASVAHRTGGSADVDACIVSSRVGDVEVSIRVRLKRGVVPGQRLPPLEEEQA